MRLLFLTPQFPYPPHKGTTLRNYNVIAQLAASHQIDLLSLADTLPLPPSPLDTLCRRIAAVPVPARPNWKRAAQTLLSPWPDMGLRLWSAAFQRQLTQWLADTAYDVIQVEGLELARYALTLPRTARLVYDAHNAETLLQQRIAQAERATRGWSPGAIYSTIQARKLSRFERRIARHADRVVSVSEADAAAIKQLDHALQIQVIPNGVDTVFYRSAAVAALNLPAHALVFTGTMDFRPNVEAMLWFADQVWPRITAAVPDARLFIVGQRPHPRLERLRADPAITLTGAVDDTRPYVVGAEVYIIPLQMGGGTRLKLLEAFALGAAVVSTTLGAEGFDVGHDRDLILADEAAAFAQCTIELLKNPEKRGQLGQAARSFAERYDWRRIVPAFEEVYRR